MEELTSPAHVSSKTNQAQLIVLPQTLKDIPQASELPSVRHRWNSNEEIASWLISFACHDQWLSTSIKTRPQNGSMILYNRKRVRFRRDGYHWKKRKNDRTTRVDHMKLKIQGVECIYGSYVHSALIPTFHRRSYWLLQNPDIVLVHYLNIPSLNEDNAKVSNAMIASSILPTSLPKPQYQLGSKGLKGTSWQRDELLQQVKPMLTGTQVQLGGKILTSESDVAHVVVQYLLDLQDKQDLSKDEPSVLQKSTSQGAESYSSVPSPQSVNSVPPSPMSAISESSTNQSLADFRPFRIGTNQTSTTANKQRAAPSTSSEVQNGDMPAPVLLFNAWNEVESTGVHVRSNTTRDDCPSKQHADVCDVRVPVSSGAVQSATSVETTASRQRHGASMQPEKPACGVSGRPLITNEESVELRAMVDNNPTLKTCRNRFENQPGVHQKSVLLPPYIPSCVRPEPIAVTAHSQIIPTNDPPGPPSYNAHLQRQRSIEASVAHHTSPSLNCATNAVTITSNESASLSTTQSGNIFQPIRVLNCNHLVNFQPNLLANVPQPPQFPPPPPYFAPNAAIGSNEFSLAGVEGRNLVSQIGRLDTSVTTAVPTLTNQTAQLSHLATVSLPAPSGDLGIGTGDRHPHSPAFQPNTIDAAHATNSSSKDEHKPFKPSAQPHPRHIPVNTSSAPPHQLPVGCSSTTIQGLNQDRSALPNGSDFSISDLDFELDFDAEMFDGAFADINLDTSLQVTGSTPIPENLHQQIQPAGSAAGISLHSEGLLAYQQGTSLPEECLKAITEFSPDWSYPEGGVKILVTGPWHSTTASYQCMFDNYGVPASLVQTGVLRCYCPAHEAGIIALQVLCDGVVISKSAIFEYKARNAQQRPNRQHEWLSLDEKQFHVAILDRLELIERRVVLNKPQSQGLKQGTGGGSSDQQLSFEDRVVALCKRFMECEWAPGSSCQLGMDSGSDRGMTLLHLAAALGFSKLINILITWRNEHHSLVLEMEVDPLNIDHFSCTPLMWAAALGHKEAAVLLFLCSPQALHVCDSLGRLPIDMAKSRGHTALAECLQHLEFDGPSLLPSISSTPIAIPRQPNLGLDRVPAFMLSSPSTTTPSSSTAPHSPVELPSPFDSPSPSSGCMSQLSISPISQGFLSPISFKSHSPRVSVTGQPAFGQSLKPNSAFYGASGDSMDTDSGLEKTRRSCRGHDVRASHHLDVQQLLKGIENIQRHDDVGQLSEQEREDLKRHAKQLRKLGAEMGLSLEQTPAPTSNLTSGEADSSTQAHSHAFQLDHSVGQTSSQNPGETLAQTETRCDSPMQTDTVMEEAVDTPSSSALFNWITEPNQKEQYLNLAEQILTALPARIKDGTKFSQAREAHDDYSATAAASVGPSGPSQGMDAFTDQESHRSSHEESSAGSSYTTDSCLPSPSNLSFEEESSTADWCEFLQGASHSLGMIGAFSLLTLSDKEQMQLYQAALVIQNAFRQYKGRQQQKQQELEAAVIIQNYYRRYKQYIMYSQMSEAAKVIQSRFRSYNHYRQFQRSRRAAIVIQSHYRGYRAQEQFRKSRDAAILIQQRFRDKRLARQKLQQDAARKIQRFIRRCQNRLRSLRQSRADAKRFSSKKD